MNTRIHSFQNVLLHTINILFRQPLTIIAHLSQIHFFSSLSQCVPIASLPAYFVTVLKLIKI